MTHFYPPRQYIEWLLFLPLVAFSLAIISLFIKGNNKFLSIFSITVWSVFYYPLISGIFISFFNDHFQTNFSFGKYKNTPLHIAVRDNDLEELKRILRNKVDINKKNSSGYTPLMYAVNERNLEATELLLERGAAIDECSENGWTIMMIAISNQDIDMVKLLFKYGVNINDPFPKCKVKEYPEYYPLFFLLRSQKEIDFKIFEVMMRNNLDINTTFLNRDGATMLHLVNNLAIAKMLISEGADVNAKNKHGFTPLHINSNEQVLVLLIENGADFNARSSSGQTPLHANVRCQRRKVCERLIEYGGDVNAVDNKGKTPLHYQTNLSVAHLLIEHGADVNASDNSGATPLHYQRDPEVVDLLIKNGADVNAKDKRGNTPLHDLPGKEAMQVLLRNGANVHIVNNQNKTVIQQGHCIDDARIKLLLNNGADPFSRVSNCNYTLLHCVKTTELVETLVELGLDVNAKDCRGRTPLATAKNKNVIEALKRHGAQ